MKEELFQVVSMVSLETAWKPVCLTTGKAMGAARATHRPEWWFPVSLLGVETGTTSQYVTDCSRDPTGSAI